MRDSNRNPKDLADQRTVVTTNAAELSTPRGDAKPKLVVMLGVQPLREFVIARPEEVIGRGEVGVDLYEDHTVSRVHAKIVKEGDVYEIVNLASKNGTRVNGQAIDRAALNSGDKIQVGKTVLKFLHRDELEMAFINEFYNMAWTDSLTQVYNRRFLMDALDRELSRARRHVKPLSVLMLDIDHFKRINDTYGHPAGDKVLMAVADSVSKCLRHEDVLGRYGGEEFMAVLPDSDLDTAEQVSERIRERVESLTVVHHGQTIVLTASVGYTTFDPKGEAEVSVDRLVDDADMHLYEAKGSGRNRCRGGVYSSHA